MITSMAGLPYRQELVINYKKYNLMFRLTQEENSDDNIMFRLQMELAF